MPSLTRGVLNKGGRLLHHVIPIHKLPVRVALHHRLILFKSSPDLLIIHLSILHQRRQHPVLLLSPHPALTLPQLLPHVVVLLRHHLHERVLLQILPCLLQLHVHRFNEFGLCAWAKHAPISSLITLSSGFCLDGSLRLACDLTRCPLTQLLAALALLQLGKPLRLLILLQRRQQLILHPFQVIIQLVPALLGIRHPHVLPRLWHPQLKVQRFVLLRVDLRQQLLLKMGLRKGGHLLKLWKLRLRRHRRPSAGSTTAARAALPAITPLWTPLIRGTSGPPPSLRFSTLQRSECVAV
mmetsp:Transcript_3270/g.5966  ORF Transcript_3270/g.5966 Transcript_3270/m.5966 type:complete len:296 (+) Transcript_3270:131-1018(+)